jgi:hypothetical protein
VSVVSPLPLLEAVLEVPPSCVTQPNDQSEPSSEVKEGKVASQGVLAPPSLMKRAVLKGQVLKWTVSIVNVGEPVLGMSARTVFFACHVKWLPLMNWGFCCRRYLCTPCDDFPNRCFALQESCP